MTDYEKETKGKKQTKLAKIFTVPVVYILRTSCWLFLEKE
jgi:hypothetical protein